MKTFHIVTFVLVLLFAFLALLLSEENRVHKQLPKCSSNLSMQDFVSEEKTRILCIDKKVFGTNLYHLIFCKPPFSLFTVKSGPPLYVFDEQGRFVGWIPDSGEGIKISEIINNKENAPNAEFNE